MTNKTREQFEAYVAEGETEAAAEYLRRRYDAGDYTHSVVQRMWNAWQASRTAALEEAATLAAGLDCAHRCAVGSEVASAIRALGPISFGSVGGGKE